MPTPKRLPKVIVRKLGKHKADGLYFQDGEEIHIDKRLKGVRKLDVYIHEYLHHYFTDMDEDTVANCATDLAGFLWLVGVRFVDNGE